MHILTVVVEAQLSAHHPAVLKPESVMADRSPYSIKTHLQSTSTIVGSVNQSQSTVSTLSYEEEEIDELVKG